MIEPPRSYTQPWRTSIQARLLVFTLVFVLLPAVFISVLAFLQARNSLRDQAGNSVRETGAAVGRDIQRFLTERHNEIEILSKFEVFTDPASTMEDKAAFLEPYRKTYTSFYVTDTAGSIVVATDNSAGDLSTQLWFQELSQERTIQITDVYYLPAAQRFVITIAAPLISTDETLVGVLVGNIDVRYFSNILAATKIGKTGEVNLVNRQGLVVITPDITNIFRNVSTLAAVQSAFKGQSGISIEYDPVTGRKNFYSYAPLTTAQEDWVVITSLPVEELDAPVNELAGRVLIVTGIAALLIAGGIYIIMQRILLPVRQLTESAHRLSQGDFTIQIPVESQDEIGQLANTFRFMAKELIDLINSLESRVAFRTRDLKIASDVARQITTVLDISPLLKEVVELTRQGFHLYFVGIFLYDKATETLRLEQATGDFEQMKLSPLAITGINDKGLVAQAARTKTMVLANDVAQASSYLPIPLLPNTCAELALPMILGGRLIGAIDLESDEVNRFSPDDVQLLVTLTEQITVAVRNAQLFEEARIAREQAEEANRVKSQFLANMSHELRTPLNAILNFSQFVASGTVGPVNEQQVDLLLQTVQSGKHLLALINDILDISKIESGDLRLFVEANVNLNAELQHVSATAQGLLQPKPGVELILDVQPVVSALVGDKRRIRQVMLNLVSNACKFTEQGSITLLLHQTETEVIFAVRDTGHGIAPEDFNLVFESFRQTQVGMRQGEGTGLGLAISRKLAEAHGGRLWVESQVGQGSTFFMSLPIKSEKLVPSPKSKKGTGK